MESLKKSLIFSYCTMPLIDGSNNEKIIIITHAGIIIGSPIGKDESDESIHNMASISMAYADDYRKENSITELQSLDGNDGFIILKDVEFKSGAATHRFNVLTVFFDQIVGITVACKE